MCPEPHGYAPVTRVVVVGDIGGTRSRILVAPVDGPADALMDAPHIGPGANVRSSGTDALERLAVTVTEALAHAGVGTERVAGVMLGMAGAGPARHALIRRTMCEQLEHAGIAGDRVQIRDDQITAFLSAGLGDDGVLLLAGTGAVGIRYEGRRRARVCDGMGWMLGDVGSAVWLGRRVLESVAADIDARGPRTALTERLGEQLGLDLRDGDGSATGDVRQDLIRAVDEFSPAQFGRFGPLLASADGDDRAREILDAAGRHFTRTVQQLDPEGTLPVVLAGSVLVGDGPIHRELITGLEADGRIVAVVEDGLTGALQLAREAADGAGGSEA